MPLNVELPTTNALLGQSLTFLLLARIPLIKTHVSSDRVLQHLVRDIIVSYLTFQHVLQRERKLIAISPPGNGFPILKTVETAQTSALFSLNLPLPSFAGIMSGFIKATIPQLTKILVLTRRQ